MEEFEPTSHDSGRKKVFVDKNSSKTSLMQFAYGELDPGERIEPHKHPTMEEHFYFIEGKGKYSIGTVTYNIKKGSYISIPADITHSLETIGNDILKFIYFGMAIKD